MINPFTVSVTEFWRYFCVASFAFLIVMYAVRWAQQARTTKAHKLIGLVVLCVMLLTLLVLGLDYQHLYVILPFFFIVKGVWLGFHNWYFHNMPGLSEWFNAPDRELGTFGQDTWLGRLLTERDKPRTDERPITRESYSTLRTGVIVLAGLLVFALGFGFVRSVNLLALFTRESTLATRRAERSTRQAVDTAVKQTATAFTSQITSLSQGQAQLVKQVTTSTQAITAIGAANGKRAEAARQAAAKAAREAALAAKRSAPLIVIPPQPIGTIVPPRVDPERVKPVDTRPDTRRRYNRQSSWNEEAATVDSLLLVRYNPDNE